MKNREIIGIYKNQQIKIIIDPTGILLFPLNISLNEFNFIWKIKKVYL